MNFRSFLWPINLLIGGIFILTLGGCVDSSSPPPISPSVKPTEPPVFKPELGAQENQPFFDKTNEDTIAWYKNPDGKVFIDNLIAAGFTKANMEVTFDRTSVDLEADSLQFAVRMGESCLIGQWGPGDTGYRSIVTPVLGSGTCLIGSTRKIDW